MAKVTKKQFILDTAPPVPRFEGFPAEAFKFLHGLKKNNNKEWFEAHRSDYENFVREPSKALVATMADIIKEEGLPLIADSKRSLFRINRDIRFSKDKSPYKTHLGIVFPIEGMKEDEWTGFYIGMEPKGMNDVHTYIGGGVHMPSSPYLKRIRSKIASDHKMLEKIIKEKNFVKEFPEGMTGESLTRPPKGFEEDHPAIDYLKMKEYVFSSSLTKADLMSPKLPSLIAKKMAASIGFLRYFSKA
jgi:uncharacterized protein (TIGR02453 family)